MKIRVYNDVFSFEEKLDPYGSASEDVEYFKNYPEIHCRIPALSSNHPVFGWIESWSQGDIANLFFVINFTHIEFTK